MRIVRTRAEVGQAVADSRGAGRTVGLVPTMGSFHEGHLELMQLCVRRAGFTVVSLFVNPIQFAPGEDLERYPRDEQRDSELAEAEGVDLLFAPPVEEMYPEQSTTFVEETALSHGLCGRSRPGHFRGVTTVVAKLFNIVTPDLAVFGRKDLQQLMVIRRMVRDLDFGVEIIEGPLVREDDGLAMSSRNAYLNPDERRRAPALYATLSETAGRIAGGGAELEDILEDARGAVESRTGGRLEYLEPLDSRLDTPQSGRDCLWLAAALHIGDTRLIDNVVVPWEETDGAQT